MTNYSFRALNSHFMKVDIVRYGLIRSMSHVKSLSSMFGPKKYPHWEKPVVINGFWSDRNGSVYTEQY